MWIWLPMIQSCDSPDGNLRNLCLPWKLRLLWLKEWWSVFILNWVIILIEIMLKSFYWSKLCYLESFFEAISKGWKTNVIWLWKGIVDHWIEFLIIYTNGILGIIDQGTIQNRTWTYQKETYRTVVLCWIDTWGIDSSEFVWKKGVLDSTNLAKIRMTFSHDNTQELNLIFLEQMLILSKRIFLMI